MKTLKKLGILALVLVMALSFAACSKDEASDKTSEGTPTPAPVVTEKTEVEKYVDSYGKVLVEAFEIGFEEGGSMTCESEILGRGNDIILTTRVVELDGLTAEQKQMMQEYFDSMNDTFKESFRAVTQEIPSLENFIIDFCEDDGDKIANIVVSF